MAAQHPLPPSTDRSTTGELQTLLERRDPPCLSIYLPTHRRFPGSRQDPIRYKNLLKSLEQSLLKRDSSRDAKALLEPFRLLAGDADFWNHAWDGLAVFGGRGLFRAIKLHQAVPEIAVVADTFHIKPLLRILQSSERFQALALNRREIRLYEGDRDHLDEVPLAPGVPATIEDALGEELTEPHQTVASYGGTRLGSNMRHGHGSRKDEIDVDEERFFRAVGRGILERHSRPSGLPLILIALPQYHTAFRELTHNPLLLEEGVEADPGSFSEDQLRHRAWSVMEPHLRSRTRELADAFAAARANGLATDDLALAAAAAAQSRVATLLVEAGRQIPGRIDDENGGFTPRPLDDPDTDDALDDLSELVLARGGDVYVIPQDEIPSATGLAATFRY